MSSEPSGCSGRARSRSWVPAGAAHRDDLAVRPGAPPRSPRLKPPKSVLCLPSPEKLVSSDAVGVVAGEREVARRGRGWRARLPRSCRRPGAPPRSPRPECAEVGPLLAVAGEARVERSVRVVAGERKVACPPRRCGPPRRSCRCPGSPPRSPLQSPRSWSSACRRRRSSSRAIRSGCSGRARSLRRRAVAVQRQPRRSCRCPGAPLPLAPSKPPKLSSACRRRRSSHPATRWGCSGRARSLPQPSPTATILPSPWSITPVRGARPRGARRRQSSACRRRRSSRRATRPGCSGRARSCQGFPPKNLA